MGILQMKSFAGIIAIGLTGFMALFQECDSQQDTEDGKPNFVWIISEDNSKHYMELFDPHGITTPHIEEMTEHGILFSRAFSNAPVCSVARSALISSCYGPRTGAQFHRRSKMVPMPETIEMFPAYLRNAGYFTTNNSKEDYNYLKSEGTWDESSRTAHWSNRQPGQPFFHKESHPVSHESRLHFKEELMETYSPVTDPNSVHLFPNHPDTELFRFTGAYYRDKILAVDTIVGKVIQQLEEAGELENTFIFYFGDHGGVLPGSKGYAYETGLHVPLVVRVPENFRHLVNFKRGSESDGFVSFIDFGPTLLELSGIEIPEEIDGKPFLGKAIPKKMVDRRETTFGYADRFDEKYDMVRTVRKGHMKYMRNYQPFNFDALQNNYRYRCLAYQQWREMYQLGRLNMVQNQFFESRDPEALFDLNSDPYETKNLWKDPAYQEILLEMRGELVEWVKGMPDLSFYPENMLRDQAFDNPVEFGARNQDEIAALVDIADLSLQPFHEAREGIDVALSSEDPMKVYWGLITCSSFSKEAAIFYEKARTLCSHEDLLVRTRAAEFLGLAGAENPVPVITETLLQTGDGIEALLILNSLVLLMDGSHSYEFELSNDHFNAEVLEYPWVQRRLEYIFSRMGQPKKE
ncbi:MAG: sulfatase [Bacteroidota bacterium]